VIVRDSGRFADAVGLYEAAPLTLNRRSTISGCPL
jgi:hypothetical protein